MLFKKIIKIILWLCLGITIVFLLLFINLTHIVESQIEKRLPRIFSPNTVEFDIKKIGFFNTFVSNIRISKGISIDSINIDYAIKSLSSIHLDKVMISGLSVHAILDENNQIKIQGIVLPGTAKDQSGPVDVSFLSFLPEKIVLQNAKIILQALDDEFLIPFDVLSTVDSKDGKIIAKTVFYPFGEKVNTLVTYDINKGIEFLKIEAKSFDLGHIDPFISKKIKGVQIKGPVDFNMESSSPQKKWKINVSQLGFTQPVMTAVKDINTTVLIDNQKINANGTFRLFHPMLPEASMEYALTLNLKNGLNDELQYDLKFENNRMNNVKIEYESNLANFKNPLLKARFNGTPLLSKGEVTLSVKEGSLKNQKQVLLFDNIKITSDIAADFTDKGKGVNSKLIVTANNIRIKTELMESSFPLAGASGWFFFDKENTPSMSMTLKASKGNITSSGFKTGASDVNIEIPIHYPNIGKKIYGMYSIETILYDNQYGFSTKGKILQTDSKEFQVSGDVTFKPLPDLRSQFIAAFGFKNGFMASLEFKTNPFKLNYADIAKLVPQTIQTIDFDLNAFAKGRADYINHQLKTSLQVNIKDGKLMMPDMNFTATGINTIVDFNDLLVPESIPGQVLTIDSIEVNKVKIDDAKIRFSIEDGKSLLVENIRFKWCNGIVTTESIRIPQENNAYSLSLYCDRLELTQLLKQIGAFNAEGSGTLNGRIPVIYSDGNIAFDNGFLFSTPGSGGKVVIQNTDSITAGIPMDSPQFVQLDLAREALKDFEYKWAKLKFNTFEDILFVNMELDGKPSKLMPFEYRKELGGFIRVDASSPGSHFQGIKLDVNLKLPFNQVMKFGNKLNSMLK